MRTCLSGRTARRRRRAGLWAQPVECRAGVTPQGLRARGRAAIVLPVWDGASARVLRGGSSITIAEARPSAGRAFEPARKHARLPELPFGLCHAHRAARVRVCVLLLKVSAAQKGAGPGRALSLQTPEPAPLQSIANAGTTTRSPPHAASLLPAHLRDQAHPS